MSENGSPAVRIMIGGGPAVLARPAGALLVDDRGGPFHRGVLADLGHTPDQLRHLTALGFDPYTYAAPAERVPTLAVRLWLDQLAVSGPVIDGAAELAVDQERRLVAAVHPTGAAERLVVDVDGTPTLAPGLPAQLVPGTSPALHSFDRAAGVLLAELVRRGPETGEAAAALVDVLNGGGGPTGVLALLDRLDPALLTPVDGPVDAPIEAIRAFAAFRRATERGAGPLCFGDELVHGRLAATAADSWIVAGGQDHALATAEALLTGNPAARVTVVAASLGTAAVHTARYVELRRRHVADDGGDGRLEFRTGAEPGAVTVTGTGRYAEGGVEAEGYAASIGRARTLPFAVGKLARWARERRGQVTGSLLFDADRQYLGYRLHFAAEGLAHQVDVTGAASWFLPAEVFAPELARQVELMGERAVPPESGSAPTDLGPVAEQAARLAAARQRGAVRETRTTPECWA
ncbi:hypothetical protein ACFWWM_24940 [Streptomyces sp. NPDC058682]|uniref:hypothetical protein n=1 Tax=unclassified Streptomyces TaxID=2593676 RepID=UPI00224CEEA2|nr:hypothetical protein [Streptomyces sp. NBC_01214]MCX4804232.1 hypothetical protein [Streptomyces sp. NBC_01214]